MNLKTFDEFCGSLPATSMVVQWGGAHVWKVGDKVFALCAPRGNEDGGERWKVVFKVNDLAFQILTEQSGIQPSPYLGRFKWVQLENDAAMNDCDVQAYIEAAHAIISKKLTRTKRAELGL